jgi:hypothetical protein
VTAWRAEQIEWGELERERSRGRVRVGRDGGGRTPELMPRTPIPARPRACRFLAGRAQPCSPGALMAAQARPGLLGRASPGMNPAGSSCAWVGPKNRASC